jgi:precorrin-3B C17-methyltransferase
MTFEARAALEKADVICGYTGYIKLVRDFVVDREILETGMTREAERCRLALERADTGSVVALVCSGDAGVYGMAGLALELAAGHSDVDIEVVAGVTAACSGAAVLGAPIGHDFAVISLSDLLTPWALIARRLDACACADMALCLYNPASRKRADYLNAACGIVSTHRGPETVCGYVRNIGRSGQESAVLTLDELAHFNADMFTTVFIGNSQTKELGGRMVTPRGYAGL